MEQEEDETEKQRRIKIAQFMNPHINRSIPTYALFCYTPVIMLTCRQ